MLLDPAPMDVRMDFIQKNVRRDVVRRVHRLATGNPGNARVPVQMVCMVIIAISPAIEPAKMDAVKSMVYVLLDALTGNLEPTVSRLVVLGVFLGVTNSMGIVFAKKAGKVKTVTVCGVNCKRQTCDNATGSCTYGCKNGFYSEKCEKRCSASCPSACNRKSGQCEGPCPNGMYGHHCNFTCNRTCKNGCRKIDGLCTSGCIDGKFGADCLKTCGAGCISGCNQLDGNCFCKEGWQGQNCNECSQTHHGQECEKQCSPTCLNGTCFSNNGSCKDVFDSNVNNDKTSPAINQTSASITNTEVYPVLYGVITVLIMSVILNIFLIVRNIRNNNRPALNRDHNHANSTINASSTIHERTEDDTNYEELGQSSEPPLYEELKCI
ncbi:multiple epidermal growth factor-like domains protein 10 [Saccostrea cucullata]|uniref:multiple epidermal growth factor-like domains protein 10 n=1 Tax=Saccostrea cuccullata TaxID=36930 RepID=UPI002ED64CEA